FLNTYIIMTTNAGSEVFNEMSQTQANLDHDTEEGRAAAAFQLGEYSRLFRRSVESTTKGSFPPELIGRVRTIAPFRSLDLSTFEKVTMRELESLVTETWKRHGCRVRIQKASKVIREGREVEVGRSEEHTSELQSRFDLVCRLLLEKKKAKQQRHRRLEDGED